jgi:hypothetical protein
VAPAVRGGASFASACEEYCAAGATCLVIASSQFLQTTRPPKRFALPTSRSCSGTDSLQMSQNWMSMSEASPPVGTV